MADHHLATHAPEDRDHALLSASGASIWLNCTRAARLQDALPDESTEFSAEGTIAHELAEIYGLEYRDGSDLSSLKADPRFNAEMHEAAQAYVDAIKAIVEPLKAAGEIVVILFEVRLDYSRYVPQGFGTSDCLILTKKRGWGLDFKYGKGVRVDLFDEEQAEDDDEEPGEDDGPEVTNEQVKLYALGALEEMSFEFEELEEFTLVIVQPRLDHVISGTASVRDLVDWGQRIVPIAQQAWDGTGDFTAGSWCQFCRARRTCKARAAKMIEVAHALRVAKETLSIDEVAALLPQLKDLEKWSRELRGWARTQAIDSGVKFPGQKLVAGRGRRYIPPENLATVADVLFDEGLARDEIWKEPKLQGLTALEKRVGKKRFGEITDGLILKAAGKPTLVPESDKRAEWKPTNTADEDFE